jgi:hypothetical protein
MNRAALGLAVGAGYVLGRTKKLKLAFAVGTLVAGKRMQLGPRALVELLNQQLLNKPQFKEIGDQLRQDLRGVGKAASGALLERQIDGIADRLHDRTSQVRDQISGVVPETPDLPGLRDEDEEDWSDEEAAEAGQADAEEHEEAAPGKRAAKKAPAGERPAKEASARKAPGPKAAKKAPAGKTAAKKTAAAKAGARGATRRGPSGEGRR